MEIGEREAPSQLMSYTKTKVIEVCRDHIITKDNKLDGEVIGMQLIFTNSSTDQLKEWNDHPEWKVRWVKQIPGDEQSTVKSFEKKYGVQCKYGVISVDGYEWHAYRIIE